MVATNYDGMSAAVSLLFCIGCAIAFGMYYFVMMATCRGGRRTSLLVLAAIGAFVAINPIALSLSEGSDVLFWSFIASLSLSSIILSITIWFDARSIGAALSPIPAVILACICILVINDRQPLQPLLLAIATWHAIVFSGLLVFARPAWKRQVIRPGLCPNCGYPTGGLPSAAPCPECGNHQSTP